MKITNWLRNGCKVLAVTLMLGGLALGTGCHGKCCKDQANCAKKCDGKCGGKCADCKKCAEAKPADAKPAGK